MNDPQDDRSRAERSATEQDLRATSASIQEHVKRLAAIERQKRRLPADHPQVETLSEAAVEGSTCITPIASTGETTRCWNPLSW